ncbi:MAG: cell wall hydrolase [Erythrobacter sp.]|jgi:hypothetical protein|nr:cell wall hydrolase [Erythrobacter sp.]
MPHSIRSSAFAAPLPPARLRQPLAGEEGGFLMARMDILGARGRADPRAAALGRITVRALLARIAVLVAAIALPVLAAPGDLGAQALGAPDLAAPAPGEAEGPGLMPFEQAGANFPGSAFYYLADPPREALVALPSADPLGRGAASGGRDVGALIDVGPAARPLITAGLGIDHARAHRCLAEAIWYEAASESEAGQRAVAQVVLNRVAHPAWPASVCGVVYQGSERRTGCQFTFTCDGSLARAARGPTWEAAKRIANEALGGAVYAPVGHATHYHTLWVNPYWARTLDHIGTIGAHHFYRNRGRGGEKSAFTLRYAGGEPRVAGRMGAADARGAGAGIAAGVGAALSAAFSLPMLAPSASEEAIERAADGAALDRAPAPNRAAQAPLANVDPAPREAGQARAKYANAGRWKREPGAAPVAQPVARPASQVPASPEPASPEPASPEPGPKPEPEPKPAPAAQRGSDQPTLPRLPLG